MQLTSLLDAMRNDLLQMAQLGDPAVAAAVERMVPVLDGPWSVRVLGLATEFATEVSAALPAGHVEVRLRGSDVGFVYVEEKPSAPLSAADADPAARITLRLPAALKDQVEREAAREGVSVNSWIAGAVAGALGRRRSARRHLTGFGQA
jgi:hypothetical protein